jgi:hypothetical protein
VRLGLIVWGSRYDYPLNGCRVRALSLAERRLRAGKGHDCP